MSAHELCIRCGSCVYDGTGVHWCEGEYREGEPTPAAGYLCDGCDEELKPGSEAFAAFKLQRVKLMKNLVIGMTLSFGKRRRIETMDDLQRALKADG